MLLPGSIVILALSVSAISAVAAADGDLERLSNIADEDFSPIERTLDRPPFHHAKVLTVTEDSLVSGWVRNRQCHRHFSVTPSLEIVFPSGKIRNITVTDSDTVGSVEVRGHAVQLKGVNEHSALCIESENLLLQADPEGSYRITAGPFYYRFLDGYFPMEVDLEVRYPSSLLKVARVTPGDQRGVEVTRNHGVVKLRSRFEGTLWVHVFFRRK